MAYNISKLFEDHADFVFSKLLIAQSCVTDKQWTSIRGCLSSNYKFSLDKTTFAGTLGSDILILPAGPAIFSNSAKVLELFVRYDFVNGQDAAIREMLMTTKNIGWFENFSSNLSTNVTHRFASVVTATQIAGVISITDTDPIMLRTLEKQHDRLYKYSVKTKTLSEYLTHLKEISNE